MSQPRCTVALKDVAPGMVFVMEDGKRCVKLAGTWVDASDQLVGPLTNCVRLDVSTSPMILDLDIKVDPLDLDFLLAAAADRLEEHTGYQHGYRAGRMDALQDVVGAVLSKTPYIGNYAAEMLQQVVDELGRKP